MKKIIFVFFISICLSKNVIAQNIDDITFYSEQSAPYNFTFRNKPMGIAVDLLGEMLAMSGSTTTPKDFIFGPWTESYDKTIADDNAAIFSITRTNLREDLFKWVGPIIPSRTVLIAKKGTPLIDNITEIKGSKIAVVKNDISESLAFDSGFKEEELTYFTDINDAITGLIEGKADYVIYEENIIKWQLKLRNQHNNFEVINIVGFDNLSFGFNKNVPDEIIDTLQEKLDDLKISGEYQAILEKYTQGQ